MNLVEILTRNEVFPEVVRRSCKLIEDEVNKKSGLSGIAIKGAFKVFKGIKPGMLENVVKDLLPEFAEALDPLFQSARSAGQSAEQAFSGRAGEAADALLQVTDKRANGTKFAALRSTYQKLRGNAKKHVEGAVPGLGQLIDAFVTPV